MIWSMNSFFVGGVLFRSVTMSIGFLLILVAVFLSPNKNGTLAFSLKVLVFYIIYILIAIFNDHQTLSITNIIFGLICIGLLISGFIIGKNHQIFEKLSSNVILFYSFLIFLSAFFFQEYLFSNSLGSRSFELDISVNTIGMAYTNSLLFLLFYSILRVNKNLSLFVRIILIGAILTCLVTILTTQSRGAIIFLSITLIVIYIKNLFRFKKIILYAVVILFLFFVFNYLISFLREYLPIFDARIEGLSSRLERLFLFTNNTETDLSGLARQEFYKDLNENIKSYILIGKNNYIPYPHNLYLEMVMRWGVFSLPLIFISISMFLKSFKYLKTQNFNIIPIPITIIILFLFCYFQSLTSLSLEMNRLLWFGFGFLISFKNEK